MRGFSKKQLTSIIISIMTKVLNENNLDSRFVVGTYKEYASIIKTNKTIDQDTKDWYIKSLDQAIAHYNKSINTIIIFIDRILKKYKTPEKQLVVSMISCFHEVRHVIQDKFDEYSFESFLKNIEDYYNMIDPDDYIDNQDYYSYEIGANLYAIDKTIYFLKKIDKETFEKEKMFLYGLRSKYFENYYSYNVLKYFEPVVQNIKENRYVPDYKILKIFFNDDGTTKKVEEIIKDENYKKLDKRIVYYIFSSNAFSNYIEQGKDEELELISNSISYVMNVLNNQEKYILKKKNKCLF